MSEFRETAAAAAREEEKVVVGLTQRIDWCRKREGAPLSCLAYAKQAALQVKESLLFSFSCPPGFRF